jgi:outer membrane murein-binding lipoprotein Lpp
MKHTKAILFAAACGGLLLTGCGSHERDRAETTDRGAQTVVTTVRTEARKEQHTLYESDDVHRETASAPDILDRAETALDDAKDKAKEMMTDAKRAVSDAAADMTETDRLR